MVLKMISVVSEPHECGLDNNLLAPKHVYVVLKSLTPHVENEFTILVSEFLAYIGSNSEVRAESLNAKYITQHKVFQEFVLLLELSLHVRPIV